MPPPSPTQKVRRATIYPTNLPKHRKTDAPRPWDNSVPTPQHDAKEQALLETIHEQESTD